MRLTIHHETVYEYQRPVANSINEAWMRPLTDERQSCLSFRLTTAPASRPQPYADYFGNTVYNFDIHEPHARLEVVADAEVLTEALDYAAALSADASPYDPHAVSDDRLLDFLAPTPLTPAGSLVRDLAGAVAIDGEPLSHLVSALATVVHRRLAYQIGSTTVMTTAEEALDQGLGVCQDYTHVFLAACRLVGVPARYVSGYLSDGAASGQGQASHAWPEAFLPGAGWIGFDVTNDCFPDERYVRVAIGRDYADVPPLRGAFSGGAGSVPSVAVSVLGDQ
ncbi:MAG TPA: transglutaminase family protein [Dehalococcoidia bacterium]|nr:transglutaminase family protein [Dehalococcoidia bacterium]